MKWAILLVRRHLFLTPLLTHFQFVILPSFLYHEPYRNLGFGIWLITSANDDFIFRESYTTAASSKTQLFASCRIYIIFLECGVQIMTKHIKIGSDLSSCSHIPAIQLRVSLPNPLAFLFMEVPSLQDLPLYDSKAEAGVNLLKHRRKEPAHSPRVREVNQLVDIARPLASDMKPLKPSLTHEHSQYVPLGSLSLSLLSSLCFDSVAFTVHVHQSQISFS